MLLAWVMPHVFRTDQLPASLAVVVRYGLFRCRW